MDTPNQAKIKPSPRTTTLLPALVPQTVVSETTIERARPGALQQAGLGRPDELFEDLTGRGWPVRKRTSEDLYRRANPSAPEEEIFRFMSSLRDELTAEVLEGKSGTYQGFRSVQDFLLDLTDVTAKFLAAAGIEELGNRLGAGSEAVRKGLDSFVWPVFDADRPYLSATNYVELREDLRGEESGIIFASQVMAISDPQYGKALDKFFARRVEGSWRDQTLGKMTDHPDLPIPPVVREACQPDGSLKIDLEKLRAEFRETMKKLQGSVEGLGGAMQDGLKLLEDLDAGMKDLAGEVAGIKTQQEWLIKWADATQKREEATRKAQEEAQTKADVLRAAGSTVYVISTLIGFADPKLGREVSVIGNSTLNVVKSVYEYAESAARLSKTLGDTLGTLGSAVGGAILQGTSLALHYR